MTKMTTSSFYQRRMSNQRRRWHLPMGISFVDEAARFPMSQRINTKPTWFQWGKPQQSRRAPSQRKAYHDVQQSCQNSCEVNQCMRFVTHSSCGPSRHVALWQPNTIHNWLVKASGKKKMFWPLQFILKCHKALWKCMQSTSPFS